MKKVLIIAAMLIAGCFCMSGTEHYEMHYAEHTVKAGETMWEIACDHMRQQDRCRDVRELCWEIKQANGLKTYAVYPGQKLTVPLSVRAK